MEQTPVQIIVAAFKDEGGADAALADLKLAKRTRMIGIANAAVLRRDAAGKLHLRETADMRGGRGAITGGIVGGVLGLLGSSVLGPLAVGAAVGGLLARIRDSGFSDARLRQLGEGLTPGTSAIVAVIEHTWVDEIAWALQEAGAQTVTETMADDIAAQLAADRELVYSAFATDEMLATVRAAGVEGMGKVNVLVSPPTGESVSFAATTNTQAGSGDGKEA